MRKGETQVLIMLGFLGLLFLMPLSGDGADLTISNVITGNGNMTLNGAMTATSFSGDGSGLTNLDPTKLSSGMANINISGNAATATTATTATTAPATTATTANSVAVNAVTAATIAFYGNVTVVAPSGGDYTDPATAMGAYISWCGTPSATNPCLLKIMPGVYDIGTSTVVMQPYIDIEGSGQNVTVITGTVSSGFFPPINGVVNGASNAEIRFLTVKNTGGVGYHVAILNSSASPAMTNVTATASGGTTSSLGVYNSSSSPTMTNVTATASGGTDTYGVYNNSSSPTMTNVTATASGGTYNYGVCNYSTPSPTMTNVTATASGGTSSYNYGVYNNFSSPTMTNVTATASGGAGSDNRGVYNSSSSPTMTNVTATGSGGTSNYGVCNSSSSPTMTNVTATGKGGTSNYGLYVSSSTVLIDRSTFDGSTNSIYNDVGSTVYIGASKLVSAAVGGTGTYRCIWVYKYIGSTLTTVNDYVSCN